MNEDKKLKSTIKKFGMQSLQDIDEVNMFKDDNTVVHFRKPLSKSSLLFLSLLCQSVTIRAKKRRAGLTPARSGWPLKL